MRMNMKTLNNLVLIGAAISMLVTVQASSNPNAASGKSLGSGTSKNNSTENLSRSCPTYSGYLEKYNTNKEENSGMSSSATSNKRSYTGMDTQSKKRCNGF